MKGSETPAKGKRERSPSYPSIPLRTAVERLATLDEHFKRHPAPFGKAGLAWGMKIDSSQASSTVAALKSFGLVVYEGSGDDLKVNLSDDGRTYLRAQQENVKREILRRAALTPKAISKYWSEWGHPRPIDAVCLDELVFKAKFSQAGAQNFLKVFDATVTFAGLVGADKVVDKNVQDEGGEPEELMAVEVGDLVQWHSSDGPQFEAPRRVRAVQESDGDSWAYVDGSNTGILMAELSIEQKGAGIKNPSPTPPTLPEARPATPSEREWLRGPLSRETGYRLLVTGKLGPKEIGKLIKLLQAQKDVLSDDEDEVTTGPHASD